MAISPFLRNVLFYIYGVAVLAIGLGIALNDLGDKYVRSARRDEFCQHYLVNLRLENSALCCDEGYHDTDWVCFASYNQVNRLLASPWAWLLAMLPMLLTSALDLCCVVRAFHRLQSRKTPPSLSTTVDSSVPLWRLALSSLQLQRYGLYLGVFAFRLIFLYMLPEYLMRWLYHSRWLSAETCWATQWLSPSKCTLRMDFSDHIVLALVHYMLPFCWETAFIFHSRSVSSSSSFLLLPPISTPSSTNSSPNREGTAGERSILPLVYWLPVVVGFLGYVLLLRMIFLTALLFHNALECMVAVILSLISIWVLVHHLRVSRMQLPSYTAP
eukprot:gene10122-11204_t